MPVKRDDGEILLDNQNNHGIIVSLMCECP